MKKIITSSFALVLFATVTSFAQLIDDAKLKSITDLLKKYEKYNQFTTDGNNIDATYTQNFVNLFEPVLFKELHNDCAAGGGEASSFATAQEYMQNATKNYPYGLDVTLDMAQMKVIEAYHSKEKNGYIVMVPKKIAGLYRSKTFFRSNINLYLFITEVAGDKQSEFKISGILNPTNYKKYKGNNTIKGLYVGLSGGFGKTGVQNEAALTAVTTTGEYLYEFEYQSNMGFALEFNYMFNRSIGLGTGVGMSTYSTAYSIGYYNDPSTFRLTDIDGEQYTPIVSVQDLVETDVYKSIEIPLLLKLRTGKGKTAFYVDLGIIYSLMSGYYTLEGNSSRAGYYVYDEYLSTEWSVLLDEAPDYDYYQNKSFDATETELVTPSGGISAYAAMGVSIPLSHNFYMKLGGNMRYGITDMELGTNSHAFGFADFIAEPGETFLRSGGIEVGISYNLSPILNK